MCSSDYGIRTYFSQKALLIIAIHRGLHLSRKERQGCRSIFSSEWALKIGRGPILAWSIKFILDFLRSGLIKRSRHAEAL